MARSQVIGKRPQHLLKLSKVDKCRFLDSFDNIFMDIDGVMWNMDSNVPSADIAYKQLLRCGKRIKFVTNNSARTEEACLRRFQNLNIHVSPEDIWHPARNIVEYLRKIKFDGLIYIIATEGFKKILYDAGFKLIDGPTKILEESYDVLAQHIFDNEPVRAVVIDVDFNLSSPKLLRAHEYLRSPECILIVGATDMLLPVQKNLSIIGPGPFSKIIIAASKKCAITLGKPGRELGELLLTRYNIVRPQRTLMIGDMLEQDIGLGKVCGFQTLLVLSGGCTVSELEAQTNLDQLPDYYTDSVADFIKIISEAKT